MAKEQKIKRAKKKAAERLTRMNPFDGLIYNDDGTREFKEGGIVGGVNNWIGTHSKFDDRDSGEIEDHNKMLAKMKKKSEAHKKKLKKAAAKKEKMKAFNPFDGLYHYDDGSIQFADGSGVVGGVNNWIQKKSHHKLHRLSTDEEIDTSEAEDK